MRSCGAGTEPPESRKSGKKNYVKNIQNPPPRVGSRKTPKKRKSTKMVHLGPFSYFFGLFVRIFGSQSGLSGVGDLYYFLLFFRISCIQGQAHSLSLPQAKTQSYYEIMDGIKCDRKIVDACREAQIFAKGMLLRLLNQISFPLKSQGERNGLTSGEVRLLLIKRRELRGKSGELPGNLWRAL